MKANILNILVILLLFASCKQETNIDKSKSAKQNLIAIPKKSDKLKKKYHPNIECTDKHCQGEYYGPEFINGLDVAHQFSNEMSEAVGDQLKELYKKGKFVKVDFSKIVMSTQGMGTGKVRYKLQIPFVNVSDKCQAYTSFDHSGGWNHKPDLKERKAKLSILVMKGEQLDISDLKRTKEGLQEYWIQWKNKEVQAECER